MLQALSCLIFVNLRELLAYPKNGISRDSEDPPGLNAPSETVERNLLEKGLRKELAF